MRWMLNIINLNGNCLRVTYSNTFSGCKLINTIFLIKNKLMQKAIHFVSQVMGNYTATNVLLIVILFGSHVN